MFFKDAGRKDKSFFPLYLIYYAKKNGNRLRGIAHFHIFVFDKKKKENY